MTAIVLDFETTGLKEPQATEAAWIRLESIQTLTVAEEFLQRYKPSKPIELGALATAHILDEDLVGCPPHTEFALPAGTTYIIGHNVDYDWNVIGQPDVKRICTQALSRALWPDADSHSQSAMIYLHYRAQAREMLQGAHAALDDVRNCRMLLIVILMELNLRNGVAVSSFEKLWEISEEARIPTVIRFGKHSGSKIADIPADYKRWLLGQTDVDPYLRKALTK
jgi:exodeoxyribonuclease X